jgi:hypothetical protein
VGEHNYLHDSEPSKQLASDCTPVVSVDFPYPDMSAQSTCMAKGVYLVRGIPAILAPCMHRAYGSASYHVPDNVVFSPCFRIRLQARSNVTFVGVDLLDE